MPGLVAGCLLVFASSTTAFISQTVIGGGRLIYLPLLIWQQSLVVFNWPLAAVIVALAGGLGPVVIAALAYGPPSERPSARLAAWRRRSVGDISYGVVIGALAMLALLIIVTPVVVVLTTSFTEGRSLRSRRPAFPSAGTSSCSTPVQSRQIHRAAGNALDRRRLVARRVGDVLAPRPRSASPATGTEGWRWSPTASSCRR